MTLHKLYHKVDAKHVKNLGEESVSDPVQAVLEMAKNAADADATECIITFVGKPDKLHGFFVTKIIIQDDGVGMSYYDIQEKWLTVGTAHKKQNNLSPIAKRKVVGNKGMGHFACMKLGNQITITSNPLNYTARGSGGDKDKKLQYIDKTIILDQDWRQYKDGEDFVKIPNELQIIPRDIPDGKTSANFHGITIEISGIKHKWTREDLERLRINLQSLITPAPIQSTSNNFKPTLITKSLNIEQEEEEEKDWAKFAPYKVVAKLRSNKLSWEFTKRTKDGRKKIDSLSGSEKNSNWKCGDLEIILYHFPQNKQWWENTDLLPPISASMVKGTDLSRWVKNNVGVKIYKDNVRIMPYGEPGNDWIQLEKRYGNRSADMKTGLPHLRNAGMIGYVILTDDKNPEIIETANRRELDNNQAFRSLTNHPTGKIDESGVMLTLIRNSLEKNYGRLSKNKTKTGGIRNADEIALREIKQAKTAVSKLESDFIADDDKKGIILSLNSAQKEIQESQANNALQISDLQSMEEMYRSIASFGNAAFSLEHQIGASIRGAKDVTSEMRNVLPYEYQHHVDKLDEELDYIVEWRQYVKGFNSVVRQKVKNPQLSRVEIHFEGMINKLKRNLKGLLIRERTDTGNLVIDLKFEPIGQLSWKKIFAKPLDFDAIFLNMITNSMKALMELDSKREEYKIIIRIEQTSSKLKIQFYDNGRGIKDEDKEKMFHEYVSIHANPIYEGMGIGLPITNEIVTVNYDGEFKLENTVFDEDYPGKGETTFMIEIPLKNLS